MRCPFCSHTKSSVKDSRFLHTSSQVRRKRTCLNCAKDFKTSEQLCGPEFFVVTYDRKRHPFSKSKLFQSIRRANIGNKLSCAEMDEVVAEVALLHSASVGSREVAAYDVFRSTAACLLSRNYNVGLVFLAMHMEFFASKDLLAALEELTEPAKDAQAGGNTGA